MGSNNTTTLAQKENLIIAYFNECGHIGFMYKNLLLNFEVQGFMEFSSAFSELDFERNSVSFPDGTNRLIVNTCRREIQMCFQEPEFELVRDAFREAALMLEVNQILNPGQRN